MTLSKLTLLAAFCTGAVLLALPTACGAPKPKCSSTTCTGCCDSTGECQFGALTSACGSNGALCSACFPGQLCQFGYCINNSSGGGTGGGSGGGTGGGSGGGIAGGSGGGTGGGSGGGTGGGSGGGTNTVVGDHCSSPDSFTGSSTTVNGTLTGYGHDLNPSCAGSTSAPDKFFRFSVAAPTTLRAGLQVLPSNLPVLALFSANCFAELACDATVSGVGELGPIALSPGTYVLYVSGASTDSFAFGVQLDASPAPDAGFDAGVVTPLANGQTLIISGASGSMTYYSVQISGATAGLTISTPNDAGTGDCDLYLKFGNYPTVASYDQRSDNSPPLGDSVSVITTQLGTYYLGVKGFSAYSGVPLTARW